MKDHDKKMLITEDGIAVRCAHDQLVHVSELKRHPENPNSHPAKQLELYSKIVRYQGFRRPATVSKRSGFITRGNGLHEMAEIDRIHWVPVDYQDYDSEEQELADVLADKYLAELSEMDQGKTMSIIGKLNTGSFDMELTGQPLGIIEGRLGVGLGDGPKLSFDDGLGSGDQGSGPTAEPGDSGSPGDGTSEAPPAAAVKCIQFYIDLANVEEYERKVQELAVCLKTGNPSDTVLECVRHVHRQLCAKA